MYIEYANEMYYRHYIPLRYIHIENQQAKNNIYHITVSIQHIMNKSIPTNKFGNSLVIQCLRVKKLESLVPYWKCIITITDSINICITTISLSWPWYTINICFITITVPKMRITTLIVKACMWIELFQSSWECRWLFNFLALIYCYIDQPVIKYRQTRNTVTYRQTRNTVKYRRTRNTVKYRQTRNTVKYRQTRNTVTYRQTRNIVKYRQTRNTVKYRQTRNIVKYRQARNIVKHRQARNTVKYRQTRNTV